MDEIRNRLQRGLDIRGMKAIDLCNKTQISKDDYCIQFDTDKKQLYQIVEKAYQKATDKADKDKEERKIGF